MNAITEYVFDMLPYMGASLLVYLCTRIIILRKSTINPWREGAILFFIIFSVGLASQTVIPSLEFTSSGISIYSGGAHKTNLIPGMVFINTVRDVLNGRTHSLLINFIGNIVMFMPFGFFSALLLKINAKKAALIGFSVSLFIETCQMFLPRTSDVDDLILNTAGALLGYATYKLLSRHFNNFFMKFQNPAKNPTE